MSTQYRLAQSGKTASGGCSAGQGSSEPVAPRIYLQYYFWNNAGVGTSFVLELSSQSAI
jgi:hypothetical protein